MPRRCPQHLRDRAVEMRRAGVSAREIGHELGMSEKFVRRLVRESGLAAEIRAAKEQQRRRDTRRVRMALRTGLTQRQVAARLGIPKGTVVYRARVAAENGNAGLIPLRVIAREVGVTPENMMKLARTGKIEVVRIGVNVFVTEKVAAEIREHYATYIDAHEAREWFTGEEFAARLGISIIAFRRRQKIDPVINAVRRRRVMGAPGFIYRYHPVDVANALRVLPRQFVGRPRGRLQLKVVADIAGVRTTTIGHWVRQGCPAIRAAGNVPWLKVHEVVAWLESNPSQSPITVVREARERALARLRAHLEGSQAA